MTSTSHPAPAQSSLSMTAPPSSNTAPVEAKKEEEKKIAVEKKEEGNIGIRALDDHAHLLLTLCFPRYQL